MDKFLCSISMKQMQADTWKYMNILHYNGRTQKKGHSVLSFPFTNICNNPHEHKGSQANFLHTNTHTHWTKTWIKIIKTKILVGLKFFFKMLQSYLLQILTIRAQIYIQPLSCSLKVTFLFRKIVQSIFIKTGD